MPIIDDILKGRTETEDVVGGVCRGGEEEPPLLGFDVIYPVAAVESAGDGPDGTAGMIWSKMAAVLNSGLGNCNRKHKENVSILSPYLPNRNQISMHLHILLFSFNSSNLSTS